MSNNYLKFFKIILKKNSLLRALQIYECSNIKLYGISLEFGVENNRNKVFSNLYWVNQNFIIQIKSIIKNQFHFIPI